MLGDIEEVGCQAIEEVRLAKMNMESPNLDVGVQFRDVQEFRLALKQYCVVNECELKFIKSEPKRITAVCADSSCKWRIHASTMSHDVFFQVKTLNEPHTCSSVNKCGNIMAGKRWIASKIRNWVKENWKLTPKELSYRLAERYHLTLPYHRIWRARGLAMQQIHGTLEDLYNLVPAFVGELNKCNPGSHVHYEVDQKNCFKRLFVCLRACIDGFLDGCRPVLGVDGCHLKTPYKGVCLSACAIDGCYQLFPVAFAVVESENGSSWNWFLSSLKIALGDVPNMVFISDRNKGLEDAVKRQWSYAEHRSCIRHLYGNMKKKYGQQHLLTLMWEAAEAYTRTGYEASMDALRRENSEAYEWLNYVDRRNMLWARHKYGEAAKCHYTCNNFSESLNAWMGEARYKPIVLFLDDLRRKMMSNMYKKKVEAAEWVDPLVSYARNHITDITRGLGDLDVLWANETLAEVTNSEGRYVVKLDEHTCTCRIWQVTGLPCTHAAAVITTIRGVQWESYVSDYYSTERYEKVYKNSVGAMSEKEHWEKIENIQVLPPKVNRQAGRPQVIRKRSKEEGRPTSSSSVQRRNKCRRCGRIGHRQSTCTEEPQSQASEESRPPGRPRTKKPRKVPNPPSLVVGNNGLPIDIADRVRLSNRRTSTNPRSGPEIYQSNIETTQELMINVMQTMDSIP